MDADFVLISKWIKMFKFPPILIDSWFEQMVLRLIHQNTQLIVYKTFPCPYNKNIWIGQSDLKENWKKWYQPGKWNVWVHLKFDAWFHPRGFGFHVIILSPCCLLFAKQINYKIYKALREYFLKYVPTSPIQTQEPSDICVRHHSYCGWETTANKLSFNKSEQYCKSLL